ncbi:MAG TPA: hypothetical protein VG015_08885 [Candidatus Dormibacteraeota bacterium]|jgi:hypothetical protein|nr:hypothetical protein [Candidatus Dormibacteraeota bacterium]
MDRLELARNLFRGGRLYDALEAAQSACERQPKSPDAWWLLACICRHTALPVASDDAFSRAAALRGTTPPPPMRVDGDDFQALLKTAGDRPVRVRSLPSGDQIGAGLDPEALWTLDGDDLIVFQINHENLAHSLADLSSILNNTLRQAGIRSGH